VDYIERAFDCSKYGRLSDRPWLEAVIPSLSDSTLAPVGKHVMSVYVQWAPHRLREGDWDQMRESLGDLVVRTLAEYAPDLPKRVPCRRGDYAARPGAHYGLTGGQIFHGEHSLDQIFTMRPVIGWAQHRTPNHGLYLCGAGTHPGGGLSGAPGAHARAYCRSLVVVGRASAFRTFVGRRSLGEAVVGRPCDNPHDQPIFPRVDRCDGGS
jgi:phytoene dehydrogenase-like protein